MESSGLPRFVTISRFSELTGYTEVAVNSKIKRGDWLEGHVWLKAPDGRRLMDLQGYERWVMHGIPLPLELQQGRGNRKP